MKIVGLDIETTGLEWGDHRIIEFYGRLYHPDGHGLWIAVDELSLRIHPGRAILPAAQAVHHISITDLNGCPSWADVAPRIHAFMSETDVFVAHNGEAFDLPFLNYEFKRMGLPEINKPICDTMLQGRFASPVGAVPNLGALCWACEVSYDTAAAHAADYDVNCMMECFFKGFDWSWFRPLEIA